VENTAAETPLCPNLLHGCTPTGADALGKSVMPVLNTMMQGNRLNSFTLEGGGILFKLVEEQV
jgi:hypothetical protein